MKLKDFLSEVSRNKKNKQHTASFKKKVLRDLDMSIDDLLDIKLDMRNKKVRF